MKAIPPLLSSVRLRMAGLSLASFLAFSAQQSHASTVFYQGFETDTGNVYDAGTTGFGSITRVASGTGGITSQSGGSHGQVTGAEGAPYTDFGGYSSVWSGSYTTQIAIYIDPSQMGADGGFDYAVASNNQSGDHLRDFVFHVTNDSDTGTVLLNADYGTNFAPATGLESLTGTVTLADVGWYTFSQTFADEGGVLVVHMQVTDSGNNEVFNSELSSPTDLISTVVGGNRYGWFTTVGTTEPLAVDSWGLAPVPEPSAALLLVAGAVTTGFRRRRRA